MMRVLLVLLLLLSVCSFNSFSQDSKADTALINQLRQPPRKNSLPVRRPVLQIEDVEIPNSDLRLKVNYWKNYLTVGINMNQASYTSGFRSSPRNSFALGSTVLYQADYTKADRNFNTVVDLQYGKVKSEGQLTRKSADRIRWKNEIGLRLSTAWSLFASVEFISQFDRGYTYKKDSLNNEVIDKLTSNFMSPGTLTQSLGLKYIPNKFFFINIGTGTAQQTFVLDPNIRDVKSYGVPEGRRVFNELAFQIYMKLQKEIMTNVALTAQSTTTASYERLGNVIELFEFSLDAKVNRLVNVTFKGMVEYNESVSTKVQRGQTLALGIQYRFPQ